MATLYDQGTPDSILCRWCKRVKDMVRGFRLCRHCDGLGDQKTDGLATWQVKK